MSSEIDICNMAISRLAGSRISSFTDGTIESNECSAIFNQISKYVQAKGPWQSNKIRTTLPQLAAAPAFGFTYQYQLPTDPKCLRVLKINEDTTGSINFQIENNVLLCDEPAIGILYIGLLTDTEQFDAHLEEAIVDHLVAAMAYKITGSMTAQQQHASYAKKNLDELLTLTSLQGSNDDIPSGTFISVRFGDGSGESPIVHLDT
jgi:hypothetical protein